MTSGSALLTINLDCADEVCLSITRGASRLENGQDCCPHVKKYTHTPRTHKTHPNPHLTALQVTDTTV